MDGNTVDVATLTVPQLQEMNQAELDTLFRNSPAGPIPNGEADGIAIVAPDFELSELAAKVINLLAWKGKVFDAASGQLRNQVSPLGIKAVIADVYRGESWFDGKECIVLDYSKTSLVAHWVRDEIREVSPALYLGIVFWEHDKLINFTLDFSPYQ
ncbi:MAG TPA: hypothetical protein VIO57_15780 [Chloroflexota bacterium]|jgi:hypothetical protein